MSAVDEFIARCDEVIADHRGMTAGDFHDLAREIVVAFNPFIENISHYRAGRSAEAYSVRDIRELRGKLAVYRDEREHELEVARLNADAAGTSLSVSNSNSSVATATANAAVTISQAIDAVDADPGLSEEQKAELQNLLTQAKGAVAKGDTGLFARIGSKIMEGVEQAAPALIAKVLEFLASQATGL